MIRFQGKEKSADEQKLFSTFPCNGMDILHYHYTHESHDLFILRKKIFKDQINDILKIFS